MMRTQHRRFANLHPAEYGVGRQPMAHDFCDGRVTFDDGEEFDTAHALLNSSTNGIVTSPWRYDMRACGVDGQHGLAQTSGEDVADPRDLLADCAAFSSMMALSGSILVSPCDTGAWLGGGSFGPTPPLEVKQADPTPRRGHQNI